MAKKADPHVRVIGGPWGKARRYANPNTKRGWSIMQPKWRFHGYTVDTLPEVLWVGASCYRLARQGNQAFYVYDPQEALCDRLLRGLVACETGGATASRPRSTASTSSRPPS